MRYFCLLGLLAAMIACGGEKDRSSAGSNGFIMPPEDASGYADTTVTNGGNQDSNQPSYTGQNSENPVQGDAQVALKYETPKLTQVQTQRPSDVGYVPSCCLVQYKADLKLTTLSGQEAQNSCYALDEICNVYPTQCLVVSCPKDTVVR